MPDFSKFKTFFKKNKPEPKPEQKPEPINQKLDPDDWKLIYCPECDHPVTLLREESLEDHIERTHPEANKEKGKGYAAYDPAFEAIEGFEYDPNEMPEPPEPPGLSIDDLFKDCPKCGSEMEYWDEPSFNNAYWFCEKCGHVESIPDEQDKQIKPILEKVVPLAETDLKLREYSTRKFLDYDMITPNIALGDIVNGWIMRDQGTGAPFNAILNVTQSNYSPPPDVEYVHIPIDEYGGTPDAEAQRDSDLRNAINTLDRWTEEGKKVYVHCTAGMNRSPSVVVGHLMDTSGMSYTKAVDFVSRRRGEAWPTGQMEDSLRRLYQIPIEELLEKYKGINRPMYQPGSIIFHSPAKHIKEKKPINPRFWPGEKGVMQQHKNFPPPGGVQKRRLKPKKKKKSFATTGFLRRVASFNKVAIDRNELVNFYILMQLPAEFYQKFPKWNDYANKVVSKVAKEYAKYLEQLVRTEAEETFTQVYPDESSRDEYHEHSWVEYGDDNHKCQECGDIESHDWTDDEEHVHNCSTCGATESHEFDSDHECSKCGGSYPHKWKLNGDQEYQCRGCGAEAGMLEEDEDMPYYGDFDEKYHKHEFSTLAISQENCGARGFKCFLCGRAFCEGELEEAQEELPMKTGPDYPKGPGVLTYEDYLRQLTKKKKQLWEESPKVMQQNVHPSWLREDRKVPDVPYRPNRPMMDRINSSRKNAAEHGGITTFMPAGPMGQGRRFPGLKMDIGKWFGKEAIWMEGGKKMNYAQYRDLFGPKETRVWDNYLIENPQAASRNSPEETQWFEWARNVKWGLMTLTPEKIRDFLMTSQRLRPQYEQFDELRFDTDSLFTAMTGLNGLFNHENPGPLAKLAWDEVQEVLPKAWKKYLDVLEESQPERARYFREMDDDVPTPRWSAGIADLSPIGKGMAAGDRSASGMAVFNAEQAAEYGAKGPIILVRSETKPEDLGMMNQAVGILTAVGGLTSHAAIVARQMGKACVVSAGFTISEEGARFGETIIHAGDMVTISGDGTVYGGKSVAVKEEETRSPEEEEHQADFNAIVGFEDKYLKEKKKIDLHHLDFSSDDLPELAVALNKSLWAGSYGGPLWALAAVRAFQLQSAIASNLPWKYRGMIVDQINTLQHNTGNIFANKPWPGRPSNFINDVLDTKAAEHGMTWLMDEENLPRETKEMMKDFERWAKRRGKLEQLFGTPIANMTPEERTQLMYKEKMDVRERREIEQEALKKKYKKSSSINDPVRVIGNTAFHSTGAFLKIEKKDERWDITDLFIPKVIEGKGMLRRLFDAVSEANA